MENLTNENQNSNEMSNPEIQFGGLDNYYQQEFTKIYESNEEYKGKWNWYSFLFGWIWCLTKGIWGYAICILLVLFFAKAQIATGVGIAFTILCGWRGTWMYYNVKIKKNQFPKSF